MNGGGRRCIREGGDVYEKERCIGENECVFGRGEVCRGGAMCIGEEGSV